MKRNLPRLLAITALAVVLAASGILARALNPRATGLDDRSEVVFWHFWGGDDRDVVDEVVRRYNESQARYRVRAIAMPGNNLQAKLFLSIAGGDPPDLVNQDDPIVGDWAARGIILPLDEIATRDETDAINEFLFPAARKLGTCDGRLFALCNGLDVRALYFNQSILDQHGLPVPQTIDDLDRIARTIAPPDSTDFRSRNFGYLPDSRRLWAWGYVFGGDFVDPSSGTPTLDNPGVIRAAQWMQAYSKSYGADTINRFRAGDQSLPGKSFPLLPLTNEEQAGRYAVIMDGQWRVRDIRAFLDRRQSQSLAAPEFGLCPLPVPPDGRRDAGWVNGNFFVVPRGAKNTRGAVEFMKFWIGLKNPGQAARTCVTGGWIPVSPSVVEHRDFQAFLEREPLFAEFVRLAASPNQFPIPVVTGAPLLKRTVEQAASEIMSHPETDAAEVLDQANRRMIRSGFGARHE